MGLFSNVRNAWAASLESTRVETLAQEMETTMNNLSKANPDLLIAVFEVFKKKRAELLSQKASWTTDRQVEIGRELRTTSEKKHPHSRNASDEAESYGLWLAGAWLESGALNSERAYIAHLLLDKMIP